MSEETGSVPASSGGDASIAPSSPAETSSQSVVSAPAGNAPGGVDAGTAVDATGTPAATAAAQFAFLKRQFRDQKHAEEVLGSEVGMTRGLQRQNAELTKRLSTMEAELNALRPLVVERQGQRQGQDVRGVSQDAGGPKSLAKELADSGELELIAKIAADPEMGMGHAIYRLAEVLDARNEKQLSGLREQLTGEIQTRDQRSELNAVTARALTAATTLGSGDYPELDNDNESEEAVAAQQAIIEMVQKHPGGPQWLATNATECLRFMADKYRAMHGTPIFAQPPGTSGSPSVRAAQAAEAAGAVAATIEGSGVPRQRQNGQPESPAERIKRENREITGRNATTPKGRPLGFEIGA